MPSSPRRPYTGSCHCGRTQYIVFLSFPPTNDTAHPERGIRIYKCNCTTCHKMGLLHVRLPSKREDFFLLSPLPREEDGEQERKGNEPDLTAAAADGGGEGLVGYQCNAKQTRWYFCPTCGVRTFAHWGEGFIDEVDLSSVLGEDEGKEDGKLTKVWRPKEQAEPEESYFSVNGMTFDAGQKGLDLREWHEKGWIGYVDALESREDRGRKPHVGGCY